jgi:hypothetical protein
VTHTIYEAIEGAIFPLEFRDPSMRNHVGDTIAFAAGMLTARSLASTRDACDPLSRQRPLKR